MRLTPKARREQVIGFDTIDGGGARCRIAVTAPPVDGKANVALLKFLAKQLRLPASALSISIGTGAREKVVHISGEPQALLERLQIWQEGMHG